MTHLACLSLLVALPAVAEPEDVFRIESRKFEFPVRVDPNRKDEIKEIQLYVSWDRGKSWEKVKSFGPDTTAVLFEAKRDGEAWFTLRIIDVKGQAEPEDVKNMKPAQKVLIGAGKPDAPARILDPTKDTPEVLRSRIEELKRLQAELEERLREAEKRKP